VTVSVPGTGDRTLLAIGDDQTRSPLSAMPDRPSTWKSKSNAANLVIITHDSLKDSFRPLQALRQSQGLKVAMVDVEDIYDEFNFGNKSPQAIKDFLTYAKDLGLDVDKFTKDLDAHTYAAAIQKEAKEVEDIGANGTPASFINGRYLSGAKPYTAFKDMIDEELAWAKSGKRPEFKIAKNVSEASAKPAGPSGPDPNKVYEIAAGGAPSIGKASAKVTLYHFFDYQCPFCVRVHPTLEQLQKDYPDDLRIVYMMHPLPMHQNAMPAAQAAMAAQAQGKFPEMQEKLFANSTALSRDKYIEIATAIGLDVKKFTADIDANAYKAKIDAQAQEAMKVGATGTPASFINGRYLSGAQPVDAFKKIIDEELAKAKK